MRRAIPLKRVALVRYGLGQPPPAAIDGIPILRATNIYRGRIVREGLIFAEPADLPLRRAPLLKAGEILVVRSGAYTADSALVTEEWEGAAPGYDLRITPFRELDSRYTAYSLLGSRAMDEMKLASSRAAQPHLNAEELGEVRIDLVPTEDQRAIADFLDSEVGRIDTLIQKKHELSAHADARWRAALVGMMGLGEKKSDTSTPWLSHRHPENWEVRPLRRLVRKPWGGDWGNEPGENALDLPCVRAADFDFANLRASTGATRSYTENSVASRGLEAGDMVIEKSGGGEEVSVGRVVSWRGEAAAMPTNFAGGLRSAKDVDRDYVLLAFRAAYEIGLPWRSIKQSTGLQNLDLGHFLSHAWPIPPTDQQRAIARHLLEELRRTRRLQELIAIQVQKLAEHRQALITAAVTGQMDVLSAA